MSFFHDIAFWIGQKLQFLKKNLLKVRIQKQSQRRFAAWRQNQDALDEALRVACRRQASLNSLKLTPFSLTFM